MGALHRPRVPARGAEGPDRDHPRHARAGEEPHAAAPRRGEPAGGRRAAPRLAARARERLRRARGRRLGRGLAGRGDGPGRSRPRGAVPVAGGCSCSASTHPRQIGSDGLEPAFATAIARAYNDYIKDMCDYAPDRMFGAAMVAPHDVPGAVLEARRAVEELGFKAVFLAPGCVNRRPWHHPAYDPLWEEIQRLDVPITFHGGGQTLPHPGLLARRARQVDAVAHVQPAAGDSVRDGVAVRRRRAGTLPDACASGCSKATAPGRRGCCTASTSTTSGSAPWTRPDLTMKPIGLLPSPVLSRHRSRRGNCAALPRHFRRRQPRVLHRLPARRLDVPARRRHVRQDALPDSSKVKICGDNWSRLYKIPLVKHT